jgi:hypothetical protein
LVAGLAALAVVAVAACGASAAPPASATPQPTPVVTPDPHLHEPVTADQIYAHLIVAKLGMSCPNANLGNGNPAIVKQINCNIGGWPLKITQYQSGAVLARSLGWIDGEAPRGDEPPYGWAGLNVAVQFGPISARAPSRPDSARQALAAEVLGVLDPLLWPMKQHSVAAIPARTPEPTPTPSASVAPTKAPKSPKPSKVP